MSVHKKVLVVDDDPDMAEQVTVILKGAGYEVVTAGTAEEAEELLLSVKPDAAVLDLMMEYKDSGFVLCHHLKQLYPGTPVILLTGVTAATGISFNGNVADAKTWIEVEKILDKPVRKEQLLAEVRRLLHEVDACECGVHH
ncbi:MAG: hypothetical protein A3K19_33190 [Lentisphaerae bacterium RIFOXYB12_FULL_65_16]|nr:MAG: hypothetical protein A3K18_02330 [Lentisphaerae bacterium RIFOXYA12_64_32]OGV86991.1 MAG: hypothetical protein A3K19_33190 [Lentisphaerae bacterium RIFOXYB12_FULL_65_16]